MSNLRSIVSSVLSPPRRARHRSGRKIIIAFSGVEPTDEVKRFISSSGGDYITFSDGIKKLRAITHLVVDLNDLKPRRIKFLVALCACPNNIVGYDWIEESVRSNEFLPSDQFHFMKRSTYDIGRVEELLNFSMESTYVNAVAAVKVGGILHDKAVYTGPGVIVKSGPSRDEVSSLVAAAGATYHSNVSGVRKMLRQDDDVTKLVIITSEKNVPDDVAIAISGGATEMSWTEFVSAVLKQDFGFMKHSKLSLIDEESLIDVAQKTKTAQGEGSQVSRQFVKIISMKLSTSPERSISNENIGNPDRKYLGANGDFEIYKCAGSFETVVRYVDEQGVIKFESLAPLPEDAHKAIQGNAGNEICMFWDACNAAFSSGGTTIKGASEPSGAVALRRHFFWFNCVDDLKLVLFHLFGQERAIVDEFFDEKGKFFASERTEPDHAVINPPDAMEVDCYPKRLGYFEQASFDHDPRVESQVI